jgi:transcriptional regulator with XRE-family HTH domain
MSTIDRTLGERLKGLRLEAGLTQEELTAKARKYAPPGKKLPREIISRVENHRSRLDTWVVDAYAHALNTTVDYLVGSTDDPSVGAAPPFPVPTPDMWRITERIIKQPPMIRRLLMRIIETSLELLEEASLARYDRPARDVPAQDPADLGGKSVAETMLETLLESQAHGGVSHGLLNNSESFGPERAPNGDAEHREEGRQSER